MWSKRRFSVFQQDFRGYKVEVARARSTMAVIDSRQRKSLATIRVRLPLQLLRPTPLSIEMPPPFGMRGAYARLQSSEHADSILPLRNHAILCVPVLFDTARQRVVPHPLLPRHTLRPNYPRHLRRIHLRAHYLENGRLISGGYYRRSAAIVQGAGQKGQRQNHDYPQQVSHVPSRGCNSTTEPARPQPRDQ